MEIDNPTLLERVIKLNEQELLELAEGEATAIAVSSKIEGLTLDYEKIRADLLEGFRIIRNRK
jgi:Fic family protein